MIYIKKIDYNNCIVNIPNSILKYFDVKPLNNTLKYLDDILEKEKPKNVILLLCDGMGINLIQSILKNDDFLIENSKMVIDSVFPTTTTSATTSIITGLYPNQHCWLGWDNYIQPIDKIITMFLNIEKDTKKSISDKDISFEYFPYKTIFEYINEQEDYHSIYLSKYTGTKYTSIEELFTLISNNCNKRKKNFIYAYYNNPDEIIHNYGLQSNETIKEVQKLNKILSNFSNTLTDSLFIITADHGLVDSSYIYLEDYPKLFNMLRMNTSIDSRACMLFVKKGYETKFKNLFNNLFSNYFILLTKKDIIDLKIFGLGKNHELFYTCLGEFIAVAISDKNLKYKRTGKELKGNHAGLTENEIKVPLIVIKK